MDFHTPVLVKESIDILNVLPGSNYIDATVGNGGHSLEILKLGGIVYGLDQDPVNLSIATSRISAAGFKDKFYPINANFNQLTKLYGNIIPKNISGTMFDLGLSMGQQKSTGRGFSFNDDQSLDMRLDHKTQFITAEEVINTYSFTDLYNLFSKLAQEKFSKPIINKIIAERQRQPIKDSQRLANIIREFYKHKNIKTKIDPSTKIMLALRIYVNNEIDNLKTALNSSLDFQSNCIVVIISFHSGEDRIVKQFIRNYAITGKVIALNSKPIYPKPEEIIRNPLSRSAILRSYKIK